MVVLVHLGEDSRHTQVLEEYVIYILILHSSAEELQSNLELLDVRQNLQENLFLQSYRKLFRRLGFHDNVPLRCLYFSVNHLLQPYVFQIKDQNRSSEFRFFFYFHSDSQYNFVYSLQKLHYSLHRRMI